MYKRHYLKTLSDIFHTRCPRCRKAGMFVHPTLKLGSLLKMHRYCPGCGQDLVPEPGFYFGAMYFSYAINVALMVTFGLGFYLVFRPESVLAVLASVLLPPLILVPWNFRISRALMLYLLGGIKAEVEDGND